jgi:hypothetical protein
MTRSTSGLLYPALSRIGIAKFASSTTGSNRHVSTMITPVLGPADDGLTEIRLDGTADTGEIDIGDTDFNETLSEDDGSTLRLDTLGANDRLDT